MPFCPECQSEYKSEVSTCTDCGVALVAELPVEGALDNEPSELLPMRNFANAAEASMVLGLLEENGIRAFLSGGGFTVAPSAFAGDIVLMVDERDMERATALHEAYFGEGSESADSPGDEAPTEPSA
jgi:hypothetical protein